MTERLTLAEKIQAIHLALIDVPHAFGGALALAYYAEPRATIDIDLNVFVTANELEAVVAPLVALGADIDDAVTTLVQRDGQVRIYWQDTPVDLFFAYDPFHQAMSQARRNVPFADGSIAVLSPEHLIVCKAVFNRPKDWVDIDAMAELGANLEVAEILRWMGRLVGDDDPRYDRVASVITR
ncbi:MAG: nucleotidyl transferase AbiEii/AbiGii toxin family protein [Acidimicrobiia bacterium]